jgi:DNA-binding MarR family transcriptional regulator/GNAT superfamily N-acetyltransferase
MSTISLTLATIDRTPAMPAAAPSPDPSLDAAVDAIRRFNRFHTRLAGALDATWQGTGLSLAQVRVLHELAHRDAPTAAELAAALSMDPGYLSRLLDASRRRGWVAATPAPGDARRRLLRLTAAGRRAYAPLERAGRAQVAGWLAPLAPRPRAALLDAMATVERLLAPAAPEVPPAAPARTDTAPSDAPGPPAVVLRPHRAGDLGWIVERHGALYAAEYGWDQRFEGMVAGIVARLVERFDPAREVCLIAEHDGARVGSAVVVRESATVAKLRLVLVEPSARGLGIGRALVRECQRFARGVGYRSMVLWTNDVLVAARAIYRAEGFALVRSEPHAEFGVPMVGEYWRKRL